MKLSPRYRMPFKRTRLGKTDYKRRLKLLKSRRLRLVVRRSLNYITAQIVEFDGKGDKIILSSYSKQLKKIGWKFACDNISAAYLTGLALGKQAAKSSIKEAILDSGLYSSTKGNRIYAVVKGAVDGGLNVPVEKEILPSNDRIIGKHIAVNDKFKELPSAFEKIRHIIEGG